MHGIYITGTDTGVGKTYIGVLLAEALHRQKINVVPKKPVESGCEIINGELCPHDATALKQAAQYAGPLEHVCAYRFEAAISPARAARLAGQTLSIRQLTDACHSQQDEFVLVEGAGGLYSPLCEGGLNVDLAVALQLPVILIASDKLGCINQVLLNSEAIKTRGLNLLAVVLNSVDKNAEGLMDNASDIREQLDCAVFTHDYCSHTLDNELIKTLLSLTAQQTGSLETS